MKTVKLFLLAIASVAVAQLNAQKYTQDDVLNYFYAIGISQTEGLEEYCKDQLGVDWQYKNDFIRGLKYAAEGHDEAKTAYNTGTSIGSQVASKTVPEISKEIFDGKKLLPALQKRFTQQFVLGIINALEQTAKYTYDEANSIAQTKKSKLQAQIRSGQTLSQASQKDADDMFYAFGIVRTQGLEEYLESKMGVNLQFKSKFIEGLKFAALAEQTKSLDAYLAGITIGEQVSTRMISGIERELFGDTPTEEGKNDKINSFLKGFADGINKTGKYTREKAKTVATDLMEKIKSGANADKYAENRIAGEKFLAANKLKPGVHVLPGGVQYKIIKASTGRKPRSISKVKCNYESKTIDGNIFDSSYERGEALVVRCNQLIKGWVDALTNMPSGSIWEIYIPQELAYGYREMGSIKPYSALIFKVELISIEEY